MRWRFPVQTAVCATVMALLCLSFPNTAFSGWSGDGPNGQVRVIAFGLNGDVLGVGAGQLCPGGQDVITPASVVEDSAYVQIIHRQQAWAVTSVGGMDVTAGLVLLRLADPVSISASRFLVPMGVRSPDKSMRKVYLGPGPDHQHLVLAQSLPLPLTPDVHFIRSEKKLPPAGAALYARTGQLVGILIDVIGSDGKSALLAGPDRVLGLAETPCILQGFASWAAKRTRLWTKSPQAAYLRGARALLSGHPDDAIAILESEADANTPYAGEIQFTLGECYLSKGSSDKAISAFLASLESSLNPCAVYKRLAWAYEEIDDHPRAEKACRSLLAEDPDNPWATMFLARILIRLGRLAEAEAAATRAVHLDPDSPCAYVELGSALVAQGRYQEAVDTFKVATWLDDSDPRGYSGLGQVYLRTDRPLHAIVVLKHAVTLDPSLAEEWCYLGRAYADVHLERRALNAYNMAVCADVSYVTARCRLAREYLAQGLCDEAAGVLVEGIRNAPVNPWLHYYLGQAYAAGGDLEKAADQCRILKEIHPLLARQLLIRIGPNS